MDFRNGGIAHAVVYQQGLNGYDEDSAKFVASARAAGGASINGRRTLIKRTVLPGTKTGIYIDGVLDESPDLEPKVIIEYINIVSADPVIGQTAQDPPVILPKVKLPPLDTRSPQQRCDDRLASLFGGDGAVGVTTAARASDTGKYLGWPGEYNDTHVRVRNGGAIHINAPDLIQREIGAFIPYNAQMKVSGVLQSQGLPFFKVTYPSFENYSQGFTLNIFHVKDPIMANGKLSPDSSTINEAGSVRIGNIGGEGGGRPGRHIHITATNGSARISMRALFCQGMGADTWREGR